MDSPYYGTDTVTVTVFPAVVTSRDIQGTQVCLGPQFWCWDEICLLIREVKGQQGEGGRNSPWVLLEYWKWVHVGILPTPPPRARTLEWNQRRTWRKLYQMQTLSAGSRPPFPVQRRCSKSAPPTSAAHRHAVEPDILGASVLSLERRG